MRIIVKLTVSIAILAGALRGLAFGVGAQTNFMRVASPGGRERRRRDARETRRR